VRFAAEILACRRLALLPEPLRNARIAIRHRAPMRWIMGPVSIANIGNIGAIEVVVAERVDLDKVAIPVDVSPDRRTDEDAGGERERIAGGIAGRVPVVGR